MAIYLQSTPTQSLYASFPAVNVADSTRFRVKARVKITSDSLTGDQPIIGREDGANTNTQVGAKVFINGAKLGALRYGFWNTTDWLQDPSSTVAGTYDLTYEISRAATGDAIARLYVDGVQVDENLNYGQVSEPWDIINRLFIMQGVPSKKFYGGIYSFSVEDLDASNNATVIANYVMDDYDSGTNTVVDRISGTDTLTISNDFSGAQWVDDGASASPNMALGAAPQYGVVLSGSFSDLAATPNSFITLDDGVYSANVAITTTITDVPTNTGTFVTAAPIPLPAAPADGSAVSIEGNAWQPDPANLNITLNTETVATTVALPAGYGSVTLGAGTLQTDILTNSGWPSADLPVAGDLIIYETASNTVVADDFSITTDVVDDYIHMYLLRPDSTVESFLVAVDINGNVVPPVSGIPVVSRENYFSVYQYLLTQGYSGDITDVMYKWLGDEGYTGSINDRWYGYLRGLGYSGGLPDMFYSWRKDS